MPVGGGSARRLTAGVSEASRPRLSPDGSLMAFIGSDDGPSELYVIPAAGGPSQRLTYQAGRCVTVGWHPATGEIIYASTADQPAGFGFRLFAASPSGGLPRLLRPGMADAITFGPDGRVVVGRNTADPARWKRYRGGLAGELWMSSTVDGPLTPLLSLPGNLANPCWVGDRIFFISDHEGVGNVYSCRPDGTDLHRHTDHHEYYARNLSSDGRRLAHHADAGLFLLDEHLPVEVAGSRPQCARRIGSASDHLEDARLSPDGKSVAISARGKAYTMAPRTGPHTGSNGEIFAQGFRSLGLGPIVGRRTWGGVIATWPRHGLVDGTVTTQAEFRYVLDGQVLENRGVLPDVTVDDETRQLAAAVAALVPTPQLTP